MAMTGMNIEEVKQLGQELKAKKGEIEGLIHQIEGKLNGTTWEGNDARQFKTDWWPKHRSSLQSIANELEGFGQSALNNASEQEQVSNR